MKHNRKNAALISSLFSIAFMAATDADAATAQDFKTTEYNQGWQSDKINAADAYARGFTGSGKTVAVFDSGILRTHTDLDGNLAGPGFDAVTGTEGVASDINGHGTFVSGIIAAERNNSGIMGVAYDSKILAVRITNADGSITLSDSKLAAGIRYATSHGASVMNNSWNSSTTIGQFSKVGLDSYMGNTLQAYREAVNANNIIVFAAGNDSQAEPGFYAALPTYYAELTRGWIAAVAIDGTGSLASYSNKCGGAAAWCLAAPGSSVTSTMRNNDNAYGRGNGTSFSAPVIAGAAAVLQQQWPSLSNEQIKEILFRTANKTGVYADAAIYGHGLLDLGAATRPVGPVTTPTPAPTPPAATPPAATPPLGGASSRRGFNFGGRPSKSTTPPAATPPAATPPAATPPAATPPAASKPGSSRRNFGGRNAGSRSVEDLELLVLDEYNRDFYMNVDSLFQNAAATFDSVSALRDFNNGLELTTMGQTTYGFAASDSKSTVGDAQFEGARMFIETPVMGTTLTTAFNVNPSYVFGVAPRDVTFAGDLVDSEAMTNPYMSLAKNTITVAAAAKLTDDVWVKGGSFFGEQETDMNAPQTLSQDPNYAADLGGVWGGAAEIGTNFGTKQSGLAFTAGFVSEENAMLGSISSGSTKLANSTTTSFIGISGKVDFGHGLKAFGGFDMGWSNVASAQNSIVNNVSDIVSQSWRVGLTKTGVVGKRDHFGFVVSEPLRVNSGNMHLTYANSQNEDGSINYISTTSDISSVGRQMDIQGFYTTKVSDDSSFAAGLLFRNNAGHIEGQNETVALARYKLSF